MKGTKILFQIIALTGLLLTLIPPLLFFLDKINHNTQNLLMFAGVVLWFIGAVKWLGSKSKNGSE